MTWENVLKKKKPDYQNMDARTAWQTAKERALERDETGEVARITERAKQGTSTGGLREQLEQQKKQEELQRYHNARARTQ